MGKYNLERLGWFNFEQLVGCLLREIIGPGVSTFSGSVDKGRDATYSGPADFPSSDKILEGEWIFQVKHRQWDTRGVAAVRSELKRTLDNELVKVCNKHGHKCDFYVFVTNCPLTASDKDKLQLIIGSQESIEKGFVLGEADIEQLLDIHPKIVRAFPQIMGIGQLRELVNWGIRERSLAYLGQVQEDLETYVVTEAYLKARELLNKQHFCIISGAPKMGKTCTGNALAASFAADDFSIVELRVQQDFYDVLNEDERQLFICDDVFGDISLQADKRDDWAKGFAWLLKRLGNQHKLLWTARTYIFKEALESSKLEEERPTLEKVDNVTVSVDDLKRIEKAMILYNHAKKAQLPEKTKTLLKGICVDIIDHPCFAPESIRQLCTGKIVEFSSNDEITKEDFLSKVQGFLSCPGLSWKKAFNNASQEEQLLCIQVMSKGGNVLFEKLKSKYENWQTKAGASVLPFNEAFNRAEGSFLKRKVLWGGKVYITFYHPSMRDLLVEIIDSNKVVRTSYIEELSFDEIASLIVTGEGTNGSATSSGHMVKLSGQEDLVHVECHLRNRLLPSMQLGDANVVLAQISVTLSKTSATVETPKIVLLILNLVIEAVCSEEFWERHKKPLGQSVLIDLWVRLFKHLNRLMIYTEKDWVPLYVGELLEHYKDYCDTKFWELSVTVQTILPRVVDKHVDLDKRELCREALANEVQNAISYQKDDLENDYNTCYAWHKEYDYLLPDGGKYEELFPEDDEIDDLEHLRSLMEEYPVPEPDYEEDPDDFYQRVFGNSEITGIFEDL